MTKIPTEYRVTLKTNEDHVRNPDGTYTATYSTPLGFANVYEPHLKAYEKRKQTQDKWAYGDWMCAGYFEKDGLMYTRKPKTENNRYVYDERGLLLTEEKVVEAELQPRIIKNEPLEGFRIVESVSRSTTDNKVWRIADPRGFELEIYTRTMEFLILNGTIVNGEIIGACIWRTPKELVRV